jgi:hypothetical protein
VGLASSHVLDPVGQNKISSLSSSNERVDIVSPLQREQDDV